MMESTINTFNKGLNRDVSPTKYSPENYFDALNVKIITDEALSSFSITNEKGQTNTFNIPTTYAVFRLTLQSYLSGNSVTITINGVQQIFHVPPSGWTLELMYSKILYAYSFYISRGDYKVSSNLSYITITGLNTSLTITCTGNDELGKPIFSNEVVVPALLYPAIIGSTQLRDSLILFTTDSTTTVGDVAEDHYNNGQIWKVRIAEDGSVEPNVGTNNNLIPSEHLIYNEQLNFSTLHRIEAYANYETSEVGKVYFTDNYNNFRHFNVLATDTFSIPLSTLSLISDVRFGKITLEEVSDNGSYFAGMVQYAYQYYNLHGSQSTISPTSGLLHLTKSSESLTTTQFYYGTPVGQQAGKSVKLTITDLDKRFTNVRVFALHYKTLSGSADITIIEDTTMPETGSLYLTDGGDTVKGTISDIEFSALGSVNFRCKSFDVKDGILFPANIVEDFYDVDEDEYWDSRAYRWNSAGSSLLTSSTGGNLTLSSINTSVPEDHDCIQQKTSQYIANNGYAYTKTNKRLGGEGPNIRYYFDVENVVEDSQATDAIHNRVNSSSGSYPNYANSLIQATKTGNMRDEVYRYAIVIKDKNGRASFAKWIADIKMPAIHEVDTAYHANGKNDFKTFHRAGSQVFINILSLRFEVKNLPASAESFEIVRVKREIHDRTVLAQGIASFIKTAVFVGTQAYSCYKVPKSLNDLTSSNKKWFNFISPEVNFNRYKPVSGEKIQPINSLVFVSDIPSDPSLDPYYFLKVNQFYDYPANYTQPTAETIADSKLILPEPEGTNYVINGHNYQNYRYGPVAGGIAVEGVTKTGYIGTNVTVAINNVLSTSTYNQAGLLLVNIVKSLSNQYGGNTFSNRLNNKYIVCYAEYTEKTNEIDAHVYGGDTFINYFDTQHGIFDVGDSVTAQAAKSCCQLLFPVESTINIAMRHDKCSTKIDESLDRFLLQETAGQWGTTNFSTRTLTQETDLYLYNNVYSRENDLIYRFSKPLNFSNNKEFDGRILSSEIKRTNEEIDSWTSFLATNYLDVDATYGPINKIITFNKRLVFFQDKALGWASVNERSLITPDSGGSTLSLGKGGVLDQYFYVSRHSGSKHQFSVTYSPNGIYYYDAANNRINVFTGEQNEPISELKGFSSYLKQMAITGIRKTDTTIVGMGVHGIYDQRFNRVFFTFNDMGYSDEYTISYNEMLQCFESFYSFKPRIYFKFDDFIYSTNPSSLGSVYLHNSGNYAQFYGNTFDSEIEILVNKDPHRIKAFTNLEYTLNSTPEEARNFNSIRLRNAYQDSEEVTLNSSNSNRRMRKWYVSMPRHFGGDDRIRGEYARIKLSFDNSTSNVRFTLNDIITHYISGSL